ncbi:hypothetical protein EG328_002856 [Venturia inaequalis]|uniref:C2H2-type domain-containing protein n=1 Tax=Venturia inaequalis TaxID=5025 RepID=A0A8H3Z062_VENIN|nr:hypothetical protein EG328_002856 [Venturia inaequalis]
MSSVPLMPIYASQRYPSPEETPPLSPYHVSNDGYGNNMSREQGLHCQYGSHPGSPLFFMPDTPCSSQYLGWSSQGQGYGSPTTQQIMYDQASTQYDSFGADCGQYQHSTYSHQLNVDPIIASPITDFSGQNLHIQMRGLNVLGSQESELMASIQQKTAVAFQTGHGQHSHNQSAPSSPFMPGYQSSWPNASVYMPLSPLSQAASPSRSWDQPSAIMAAPVLPEGRYRELSSSGSSSVSRLTVVKRPTVTTRRRLKKDKSPRRIKCETFGCLKDFDRPHNAKMHQKMVHGNPERKEICPLLSCTRGFARRHDMIRHLKGKHTTYAVKHEDIYGPVVVYTCEGCGRTANRKDIVSRHNKNTCPGMNAVKIVKKSSSKKGQRGRAQPPMQGQQD